jgi:hypothetical protein
MHDTDFTEGASELEEDSPEQDHPEFSPGLNKID